MDNRRLSTFDIIGMGIINKPIPITDIPGDREEVTWDVDPWNGNPDIAEALEGGKVVSCLEYYGIPYIWKDEAGYHGRLLQYRSVSASHDWTEAADAIEWFKQTAYSVAG